MKLTKLKNLLYLGEHEYNFLLGLAVLAAMFAYIHLRANFPLMTPIGTIVVGVWLVFRKRPT